MHTTMTSTAADPTTTNMSRGQQPSIRSFFQPRRQPEYAPPPDALKLGSNDDAQGVPTPPSSSSSSSPAPPPPPPQPQQQPLTTPLPPNLPTLPSPPSLPPQAAIVPITEHHIPALRRINSLLLPVAYPDAFYTKVLDPLASGLFSRAILWTDTPSSSPPSSPKLIGGLICRLEPNPFLSPAGTPTPTPQQPTHHKAPQTRPSDLATARYHAIYIQSLSLLSPYRSQGLAAAALEHIVASAALLPAAGSSLDVRTVYAHVWTENREALAWYEARGFARADASPLGGYYFKLRPDTAWVMKRDIGLGAAPPAPAGAVKAAPTSSRTGGVLAAAVNLPPMTSPSPSIPAPASAPPSGPPSRSASSLSFQNARPESEWNDLPPEMVAPGSAPPGRGLLTPSTTPGSGASSRSSSTARKKKERAYPAAAFG
ncbi:hypothetical protein B0T22DRAFT_46402 [Podospora appendiculata]|uniref:N-acetyltransferase domain-containing protein n=1 Tax=Podospora appendiculata TaxID=314037 RepID=A0AAE0XIM4_9PEZI|nr:hypothetical protein B0T22DRAFT_46402 [Podospora appendiculata]